MACCADEAPCQHQDYISRLRNLHFSTIILDPQIMQNSNRGFIKITFSDRKIYIFSHSSGSKTVVLDCTRWKQDNHDYETFQRAENLQNTDESYFCLPVLARLMTRSKTTSFFSVQINFVWPFSKLVLTQFRLQDWKNKRRDVL